MKKEDTIDFHIKSCWHSISRMYNQKANMEGITTSMGFVLINIDSNEGTAATKIAPMMGLESRSLTRILKSMEQKGLIRKSPDPVDKRSVRIFLTSMGKEKKSVAVQTVKYFNEQVRNVLSEQEMKSFFTLFEKINRVIQNIQKA
ncbi:MarR family winged helix-turn-helix transcriptional regulator [Cyclobacterium plantarum]|uniref:MarR family transcriptional regulator n=1 Tax=Cyclobacterium plantarum TaxID=2716263 RepID=A0ABX0HC94_9BACT|nr:MarR family transcriptional regulator [Cyclobacterium plantarum]NHE59277.1 MarR family transcriptional regulator [Cyclobacterium plantarum]